MNKPQSALMRIFCAAFAAVFLWLSWLCITKPIPDWLWAPFVMRYLLWVLAAFAGVFAAAKLLQLVLKPAKWQEPLAVGVVFTLYIALQIHFALHLYSAPGTAWDFNIVAEAAKSYVLGTAEVPGSFPGDHYPTPGSYFRLFPNNIPLYLLLIAVLKPFALFGANLEAVAIGFNILCIDVSLLLTYLTVKKLTGRKISGFMALLLAVATLPILCYVAIYYTDTVTLPFPILTYHLWLLSKDSIAEGNKKQAAVRLGLMGLAAAFGASLKLSAGFMLAAVVIDACLTYKPLKALKAVGISLLCFLTLYGASSLITRHTPAVIDDEEQFYIPKQHWVMMGLKGNGNYNDADYQLTLSVHGEDRDDFVKAEIRNRLKGYGSIGGFMEHIEEKCAFVWGEASYMASYKIDRSRAMPWPVVDDYLIYTGDYYYLVAPYNQAMLFLNLVSAAAAALWQLLGRKKHDLLPCLIALFGLFLFLCIWEARSRYLFNYLPVFITVTTCCLCGIGDGIGKLLGRLKAKKS